MADPLDPFGDLIAPLPPPAALPGPAPVPTPVGQDPRQRLALIAALGAALAGGRQSGMGGLIAGLQHGQQQQDQANLQRYQVGEQERIRSNQIAEHQQALADQQEAHRQAAVQNILSDFQKRMPSFQTPADYEQQIGVTSNMLRGLVGSRLNDQVLRARYPYTAPKIETLADKALSRWMGNPANKRLLEKDPEAASKAVLMFDRDQDGIPERTTLLDLANMAGKPFAQTADGLVASPKGTTKEDVASADAIYRDLHQQAMGQGKEDTPELRNMLREQALQKHKAASQMPNDTRQTARSDRSYQFTQGEIGKIAKPLEDQASNLQTLRALLDQGTPAADALVAPKLLSTIAGGTGSGLRMNEAELSRIVGGRSNWENLKASMNRWSLDPNAANSITPAQRQQIRNLVGAVTAKSQQKLTAISGARQRLIGSDDPQEHKRILAELQKAIEPTFDQPAPTDESGADLTSARNKLRGR